MRPNFGRLLVDRIIVHVVPRRLASETAALELCEVDSPLDDELKVFFQQKIKDSLIGSAYDIVLDSTAVSPCPALIHDHLSVGQTPYIDMSRQMATRLYATQTGVNPSGVLVVIQARAEDSSCLALLKLEWEYGVRLEASVIDGLSTFEIHQVKNLLMTERTKVYKAAAFWATGNTFEDVAGVVCDLQASRNHRGEVASFFLRDFLGCQYRQAPDKTTKAFFEGTLVFIDQHVEDSARKAEYLLATIVALKSNDADFRPRYFAESHLHGPDRNAFMAHLESVGAPVHPFPKDNTLIEKSLNRTRFRFESGLVLYGPPESFADHVEVDAAADGTQVTHIRDRVVKAYA